MIIFLFFFMILAIAGLQLLSGMLKKRCFHYAFKIYTAFYNFFSLGISEIDSDNINYCSSSSNCEEGFTCGKIIANPD